MNSTITYGNSKIKFSLEFKNRKTLRIQVHPNMSVRVIAPKETSIEEIKEKVLTKASWIQKQQDFFLSYHPLTPPRKYVSGETHLYLGKQYRLKLIKSDNEFVKMKSGYLFIHLSDTSDKIRVQQLLQEWYKCKADYHFNLLFEQLKPISKRFTKKEVFLKNKWMKKKWGTCNDKGIISLNYELIKSPKKCIEYVIIHELCHMGFLNHSRSFYNLLEKHLPDWKKTKQRLEEVLV